SPVEPVLPRPDQGAPLQGGLLSAHRQRAGALLWPLRGRQPQGRAPGRHQHLPQRHGMSAQSQLGGSGQQEGHARLREPHRLSGLLHPRHHRRLQARRQVHRELCVRVAQPVLRDRVGGPPEILQGAVRIPPEPQHRHRHQQQRMVSGLLRPTQRQGHEVAVERHHRAHVPVPDGAQRVQLHPGGGAGGPAEHHGRTR
ncbi:hypothetical protein CRUP_013796, partial [Coryphaenoides rupestris]